MSGGGGERQRLCGAAAAARHEVSRHVTVEEAPLGM